MKSPAYYYGEASNLRIEALRLERQTVDKIAGARRDHRCGILRMAAVVFDDLAKEAEKLR